jgi:hypothetical protein
MALSPRLLRPLAGQSMADADATDYLRRVQEADGQALEPAVRNAITAFVVGCKQDGIWSAIKASCILMGARTLAGALVPLKGSAPTNVNNNFVSGDYNRTTGLVGDGSTKGLDLGLLASDFGQNNNHFAALVTTAPTAAMVIFGTDATGNLPRFTLGRDTPGSLFGRNSTAGFAGAGLTFTSAGFYANTRNQSANYTLWRDDTSQNINQTSSAPGAVALGVFYAPVAGGHSNARIQFFSVGDYLLPTTLRTRVNTLATAIAAAIP